MTNWENILQRPQNRYWQASPTETPEETISKLETNDEKSWWHLVVRFSDGTWHAIKFRELVKIAQKIGPDFLSTKWECLPIPHVESIKQNEFGPMAAKDKARESPGKLIIATDENENVVGIVSIDFLKIFSGPSLWELWGELADLREDPRLELNLTAPVPTCPHCSHKDYFDYDILKKVYLCKHCKKTVE